MLAACLPSPASAADTFVLGDRVVNRIGYGAMQLAGPGVMGPPADPDEAVAVLRRAVELGVNHIDTSDFYGPFLVNELIARALRPYPDDLVLVTKVGARRDAQGNWPHALSEDDLRLAVDENLEHLQVDVLEVVNLRVGGVLGPGDGSIAAPFSVLAALQQEGKTRHLGVSNVTATQLAEAQGIAPVVCVQNNFNISNRGDGDLVDLCAGQGIAHVPFFPLGGFSPIRDGVLSSVAQRLGADPTQVALAWLLHRSPALLAVPGTKSRGAPGEQHRGGRAGPGRRDDARARRRRVGTAGMIRG